MSNTQTVRTLSAETHPPDLHPNLRAQLHELHLRTGNATPDLAMLLQLINAHYQTLESERRGIAESMRLMADEARALAREAHAQSSEHLQVILDHIKDVVLALDEEGVIRTFNPTGERVFGYAEAEVIGQRVDLLIPEITIATGETVPQALQRLAASLGDTALDLAARELWARRKDGERFPAEIAVSKAPLSRREMFVSSTGANSTTACTRRCCPRSAARARTRCCTSILTSSRWSTTPAGIRRATGCCAT